MEGNLRELKQALLKCADENRDKPTVTGNVVVSSICRASVEAIDTLLHELGKEKKINEEIKVRFVKCNKCTPEMKDKCLMFNENLCEGERCEELVDLMSLVTDREKDNKLEAAKESLQELLKYKMPYMEGSENDYVLSYLNARAKAEKLLNDW